jgi:hypothetical protein
MEELEEIKKEMGKIDTDMLRKIDEEKLLKLNMDSKVSDFCELFETDVKEFSTFFDSTKHIICGLVKISKLVKEE